MKLKAMFAIAAILFAGCGSEPSTDAGPNNDTPTNPTGNGGSGGNGNGGSGGAPTTDQDAGTSTGGGDQDSGTTTGGQDSGSGGGDQDGGTGGQDSGSGGGDQDGGATTGDGGSGGGDQDSGTGTGGGQDSGSGGGDQDGGTTTGGDSGSGGGGGDQDAGTGGGSDSGSGGGGQDSGGGDHCTPHSCTYTQGYYKSHTSAVTGLVLGGVSYSQSEVLGFLNATPNGDDSLILAKQLIAALLNAGDCDPNASATVQAAQSWMAANKDQDGRLPYGTMCVNQSDPGCTAWSLGQTLDAYNSGNSGTPHCQ